MVLKKKGHRKAADDINALKKGIEQTHHESAQGKLVIKCSSIKIQLALSPI